MTVEKDSNLASSANLKENASSDKVSIDHDLLKDPELLKFSDNPIGLFQAWFQQAFGAGVVEPYIMFLATATTQGIPSCRCVGMGNVDERGFYFATNKESRKFRELESNPVVAASFYWQKLYRTIRIEGKVEPINDDGKCFRTWPRAIQIEEHSKFPIGQPQEQRKLLAEDIEALTEKFADVKVIPQPSTIKAFVIVPHAIEFLQVNETGPKDRILFERDTTKSSWKHTRLSR